MNQRRLFRAAWFLAFSLLITPARAAQPQVLPEAEGRQAATNLVAQMLAEAPSAPLTNHGFISMRRPNASEEKFRLEAMVIPGEKRWESIYQVINLHILLKVVHVSGGPNRYEYQAKTDAGPRPLAAEDLMTPFAGSDFWIADLGLEFLHWPDQRILRREIHRGQSCDVLESKRPGGGTAGYSRVISWIDADSGGIINADAYDGHGEKVKVFSVKKMEKVRGEWQLRSMEMRTLKSRSQTLIEFNYDS